MKTHHAQARMQQRGVRNDTIDFILEHADCCVPRGSDWRGDNREALSVSRTRLNKMCHELRDQDQWNWGAPGNWHKDGYPTWNEPDPEDETDG